MCYHRFRVQIKAIDETGSTSFVMFDKVITPILGGRSASDILHMMNKVITSHYIRHFLFFFCYPIYYYYYYYYGNHIFIIFCRKI